MDTFLAETCGRAMAGQQDGFIGARGQRAGERPDRHAECFRTREFPHRTGKQSVTHDKDRTRQSVNFVAEGGAEVTGKIMGFYIEPDPCEPCSWCDLIGTEYFHLVLAKPWNAANMIVMAVCDEAGIGNGKPLI